ncbi:reverse transcriptase domain-containing protein [Trichonephila clavipes]|nr:reverse transcriptase domain-containing protein [Trichonephila clavipes]
MRSEFKPRTITCRNKRGELVSEQHEVTKVWKYYFQDLLQGIHEPIVLQNVHTEQDIIADEENPPPSITEVTLAIKKVKKIKTQKYLSLPFTTERDMHQGDLLVCLLFNLVLGKCIRNSGLDRSGTLWNRSLQLLAYADDIDIIGRPEKAVKEAFQALEISATNMGLTINEDKTKLIQTLFSSVNNTSFCVKGHSFERVSEFKYLGTIINGQNKL